MSRILLKRKAVKSNSLVLTFDDGPGSRLTPAIMDLLAEHNAKATFFLLGRRIAGREEIVQRIATEGHDICSHGYDHLDYWRVSPLRTVKDIKRGWQAIDAAMETKRGKYPFRPPNGRLNIISLLYLLLCRVSIVYWSVDLGDTLKMERCSERIALAAKRAGGVVSLAHDFDRSDKNTEKLVLESTRIALATAKANGMTVLTYSQLRSCRKSSRINECVGNHS
jgi:peptidoglycan/xylan/chitin deacetylase (PgdA/CDA1 family)